MLKSIPDHFMLMYKLATTFLSLLFVVGISAQEKDNPSAWYVGAGVGIPAGTASLSSFAADGFHTGWSATAFGGYRFNELYSLEAFIGYGQATMAARKCCASDGDYLGPDWVRYYGSVLGMECLKFSDIRTVSILQQYGTRFNFNVFGLFAATRQSGWSLELSPKVALYGSRPEVTCVADASPFIKREKSDWHFGYGADLQASYRVIDHLKIGITTGVTGLTGARIDGIVSSAHKSNFTWDTSVRFIYEFGGHSGRNASKSRKENVLPDGAATVNASNATETAAEEEKNRGENTSGMCNDCDTCDCPYCKGRNR